MSEPEIAQPSVAPQPIPAAPVRRCENCGEVLLGTTCYACGQPTKGLVRQFSSIFGDFIDTVFNVDSRLIRTLPRLLFKPGYLSQAYFDGQRVRYVSPVRLFVFLAILTFVLAQAAMPDWKANDNGINIGGGDSDFSELNTVAEVIAERDEMIAGFQEGIDNGGDVPGLAEGMRIGQKDAREAAAQRIAELTGKAKPKPKPKPKAGSDDEEPVEDQLVIMNDQPWHPKKNPVQADWLPSAANKQINSLVGQLKGNAKRIKKDPNLLKAAVFNALPTTLFVLVPVFAVLLKLFYLFKKRLYMEHLIVALHSHAFLCLAVISLIGLNKLDAWAGAASWLSTPLGLAEFAMAVWMPAYLLFTQKRIYRQGWPMTLAKFGVLGIVHLWLLAIGVAFTMVAAAIWL